MPKFFGTSTLTGNRWANLLPIAAMSAMIAQLRSCHQALARGESASLVGAFGSQRAWLLASLASQHRAPLVVVCETEERGRHLMADLAFFLGSRAHETFELSEVAILPAGDSSPYTEMSGDPTPMHERMTALFRLVAGPQPTVLVCPLAGLRRRLVPRDVFEARCLHIAVDAEVGREHLVTELVRAGYLRTPVVDDPGTFSVRGSIVDVFAPASRFPARIEFFDELVESIRLFDPTSQRTLRQVDAVPLYPVRETMPPHGDAGSPARQSLLELADALAHPTRQTRALIEDIESGRDFVGSEAYLPAFFHEPLQTLFDYVPEDAIWVLDQPALLKSTLAEQQQRDAEAYQTRIESGALAFAPDAFYCPRESLEQQLAQRQRIELGVTTERWIGGEDAEPFVVTVEGADNADLVAELKRARAEQGEMIFEGLAGRLTGWQQQGRPVVIAAGSRAHAERLEGLLEGYGIDTTVRDASGVLDLLAPADDTSPAQVGITLQTGALSAGFRLDNGLVVLSHEEIFGAKTTRRPARRAFGAHLGDLRELKEGHHVVHSEHGVGRYAGLVQKAVDGIPADYLLIEYHGGDRLYLPVYRMSQVAKYVGADSTAPRLDKLGGVTWQKKQRKVQADVRRLGEELLQLYAQRQALEGHAYDEPDATFAEFVEAFPFSETDDQQRAIDDVIADLVSERPMDRLVCGDVGFGKTEVALRAAFVVAMAGRQVALLAPTTVLVEQHSRTFRERMDPFALRVETASRFSAAKDLNKVLADLKEGRVDIIIATHRLLSSDVRFRDLGLLIVDEEQRFGVKHKEQLKALRTQVDVLTLTATPIPRTLQMSMVGMREISVIATPPMDRLAIRTVISRYSDLQLAEGIRRELARGGQVFFVHNEVQSIDEWAARVADLVPEARVAVGHGQMDSRRLERVMLRFVQGESDVLVCTTIIESGLDIPRANTMFVNNADRFGLSQLYQLRGRIGRSRRRAYCFLLVRGLESMAGDARLRLEALARFSQLGSGFSVASYDLELRGAGELLGGRQSGHIAALGFEAYARILQEAVAELKGEPIVRETDPELKVRVPAFIPDDYVEDTGARLELYKRLADACRDEEKVDALVEEIHDRYGTLPDEVRSLGQLMMVKGLAMAIGATLVDLSERRLSVGLGESCSLDPTKLTALVTSQPDRYRLTPDMRLNCSFTAGERGNVLAAAKKLLRELAQVAS